MTDKEADKLIMRVEALYIFTPFKTGQAKVEYVKYFIPRDYELMEKTIQKIMLEGTSKYRDRCPTIAEINEEYVKIVNIDKKNKFTKADCLVCMGQGFMVVRRTVNDIEYDFLLHCECEAGDRWKYDGQNNTAKTDYCSEPISKYFDLDIVAADNKDRDHTIRPMPDYVKNALKKALEKIGEKNL